MTYVNAVKATQGRKLIEEFRLTKCEIGFAVLLSMRRILAAICLNNVGWLCYKYTQFHKNVNYRRLHVYGNPRPPFAKLSKRMVPHQLRVCNCRGIIREKRTSSKPTTG